MMSVVLPAKIRKRGNSNWGRPIPDGCTLATEFDLQIRQLRLTAEMYASSAELRSWCQQNKERCFIPEWLLKEWDITGNPNEHHRKSKHPRPRD
jgi:hypothetical protein